MRATTNPFAPSSLGAAYYELASCVGTYDTQCVACGTCQHLYYPSSECSGSLDTVCSLCVECAEHEYETSPCSAGQNRICASCQVCTYLSAGQEVACNAMSQSWRKKNCCFDSEGTQVACAKVDFANLGLQARNGRHHWAFPDTTPKVEGYGIHEWTG